MNNTDDYLFLTRSVQTNYSYFDFQLILYTHMVYAVIHARHLCNGHVHRLYTYILIKQSLSLSGKVESAIKMVTRFKSCDVNTCPSPIIVPPHVPHTFWLDDNKEDLVVIIRLEPIMKNCGMREAFFENWAGVSRDQQTSIFQLFLLLDNARTYPALSPLILSKNTRLKQLLLSANYSAIKQNMKNIQTSQLFD